jgi:hypothetical protein
MIKHVLKDFRLLEEFPSVLIGKRERGTRRVFFLGMQPRIKEVENTGFPRLME